MQDGTGTDDQNIQNLGFNNATNVLTVGIEDGASQSVDLSSLAGGGGTDDQNLTGATLTGTILQIDIEDGASASVDLSSLSGGGTNIYNADGVITGDRTVTQGTNDLTFSSSGNARTVVDGTLQFTGAMYGSIRTHNAPTNIVWGPTDFAVVITNPGISNNLLLPDPTLNAGRILAIRNNAGTPIQFAAGVGAPVNLAFIAGGSGYTFMSDGTDWHPIGSR